MTGSIVSAGFGAAAGGLMGGMKGMQKGAMFGAVAGGALGAASPALFGMGAAGASSAGGLGATGTATSQGLVQTSSLASGLGGGSNALTAPTIAPPVSPTAGVGGSASVAPAGGVTAAPAGAAPAAGGGFNLGSFFQNPMNTMMAGNVIQGLFTPSESSEMARFREREGERLFSDIYSSGDPFGRPEYGTAREAVRPVRRFRFNPETLSVEEVEEEA